MIEDAGGVFCHADVRVCGIETTDRGLALEPSDSPEHT
jgi:hypothetical protein